METQNMTLDEMRQARNDLDAAIQAALAETKESAKQAVTQWLKDGVLSADELRALIQAPKRRRAKPAERQAPKTAWVDPADENLTYTGRGKLPEWLRARFAANGVPDDSKARAEWIQANLRKAA